MVFIRTARPEDVGTILDLISGMQSEIGEVPAPRDVCHTAISRSLSENVHWFLFYDDDAPEPFGTCYMQSVHNYWRVEKRFYLGGFYIRPNHRGQGRFRKIYDLLKDWTSKNGGVQIYAHIHQNNRKSLSVFKAVGLEEIEYKLLADSWDK